MYKLMAANWKMYKTHEEAKDTIEVLVKLLDGRMPEDREVLVFPPFTVLHVVARQLRGKKGFFVGGQNFWPAKEGAFTGEISPNMLKDMGATFVLTGHSERRHVFGESDELIGFKTAFGLNKGLKVILCVGETIEERNAGQFKSVLERQIMASVTGVPKDLVLAGLVIAYEPVWAIGTGNVAGPKDILEAHSFVRELLDYILGKIAGKLMILYGGSVKLENATEIIGLDNVDGVLVGGASLKAENFASIVLAGL